MNHKPRPQTNPSIITGQTKTEKKSNRWYLKANSLSFSFYLMASFICNFFILFSCPPPAAPESSRHFLFWKEVEKLFKLFSRVYLIGGTRCLLASGCSRFVSEIKKMVEVLGGGGGGGGWRINAAVGLHDNRIDSAALPDVDHKSSFA